MEKSLTRNYFQLFGQMVSKTGYSAEAIVWGDVWLCPTACPNMDLDIINYAMEYHNNFSPWFWTTMVIIINYLQKIHRVFEPFLKQWYSKVPVMMIQENDNVKYCKRDWLPLLSTSSMHVWITCGMLLPSRLQNELHMDLRQCSIGKWNWNTYFWLITADKCLSTIIGLYTFLIDNKHQCATQYNRTVNMQVATITTKSYAIQ